MIIPTKEPFKLVNKIIRKISNRLYKIELPVVQILFVLSSRKFLRSKLLNKLQIQNFRILLYEVIRSSKLRRPDRGNSTNVHLEELHQNGIVRVENFLSDEEVLRINNALTRISKKDTIAHSELQGTGTSFTHIKISEIGSSTELEKSLYFVESLAREYLFAGKKPDWYVKSH